MTEPTSPPSVDPQEPDQHVAPAAESSATSTQISPAILALGFIVMILLGVLITQNLKTKGGPGSEDPALVEIKAEIERQRDELKRQSADSGLISLSGSTSGESATQIATRLKRDADLLAGAAAELQSMLAQANTQLTAKNAELISSEQTRQTLVNNIARLQSDLNRALVESANADQLKRQLADATAKRDALMSELEAARQKLSDAGNRPSTEAMADVQRRLDEATRAKGFFETRVKELEARIAELE